MIKWGKLEDIWVIWERVIFTQSFFAVFVLILAVMHAISSLIIIFGMGRIRAFQKCAVCRNKKIKIKKLIKKHFLLSNQNECISRSIFPICGVGRCNYVLNYKSVGYAVFTQSLSYRPDRRTDRQTHERRYKGFLRNPKKQGKGSKGTP